MKFEVIEKATIVGRRRRKMLCLVERSEGNGGPRNFSLSLIQPKEMNFLRILVKNISLNLIVRY